MCIVWKINIFLTCIVLLYFFLCYYIVNGYLMYHPNTRKLFAAANIENISVKFINIDDQAELIPTQVLPHRNYARTACVFDYGCEKSSELLRKFSDDRFFNITYSWLFVAGSESTTNVSEVLWKLKYVQLNTDLTVAQTTNNSNNGTSFELMDIYSHGRHLCKDIHRNIYGRWDNENGTIVDHSYSQYYTRGNYRGLQLRGVVVIDRDNVTSDDVDRLLTVTRNEPGVVAFEKYHYSLLSTMGEYHNFSVKYRLSRGWAGRLKSGYRLGLIGILSRDEADVAATGIFQRTNRHAEFDVFHQSWEFTTGFIYRITPQLAGANSEGNFFAPFDNNVWTMSLVTLLIVLVVLKIAVFIIFKVSFNEPNTSMVANFIDIIGTVAQQGLSNRVSSKLVIRIIMFSLLAFNLILFNYYTSAVVSGLLSSPGRGPVTIRDVIDSPLELSFLDIGYHKILFRESKKPIIRELYDKKVKPPREGLNSIPVYTDVTTAVPYLQKGGYAFHCEMTEAFQNIAEQFDANEICELRTTQGLFTDLTLFSFVLPKRSMYTEMFKITMARVKEVGLVSRALKIYRIEKPTCQVGARAFPVELSGASMAFMVLAAGMIASVLLLVLEKISKNVRGLKVDS